MRVGNATASSRASGEAHRTHSFSSLRCPLVAWRSLRETEAVAKLWGWDAAKVETEPAKADLAKNGMKVLPPSAELKAGLENGTRETYARLADALGDLQRSKGAA